ncbi:hypothetical protein [Leisingera sp. ANG59]|uniref:hypothetical protein n=1 Tax=Leisingera sp. ANG59 TaxID=2675221 RepID=UPI0015733853|nr:hypothetical protein [Leisingera sp. ANG59]NSY40757.1 hypothetical protein [Leisingera sp. ANG59]
MKEQLKREKANEETDKHLAKLKKEHEETRKLIIKEIRAAEVRAKKIEAACLDISKDVNAALDKLEAIKRLGSPPITRRARTAPRSKRRPTRASAI